MATTAIRLTMPRQVQACHGIAGCIQRAGEGIVAFAMLPQAVNNQHNRSSITAYGPVAIVYSVFFESSLLHGSAIYSY